MDLERCPHRGVMLQVDFYSLKGAHEMISRSLPHLKNTFVFVLFCFFLHIPIISDQVLLLSDLLLKTVALVKHTDTRPGQNRTETHFHRVADSYVSLSI